VGLCRLCSGPVGDVGCEAPGGDQSDICLFLAGAGGVACGVGVQGGDVRMDGVELVVYLLRGDGGLELGTGQCLGTRRDGDIVITRRSAERRETTRTTTSEIFELGGSINQSMVGSETAGPITYLLIYVCIYG
jgi:hypothetical protein